MYQIIAFEMVHTDEIWNVGKKNQLWNSFIWEL